MDNGCYEFLRMPFELKGALATFQRIMDNVRRELSNILGYIDDILVYSTSLQEHLVQPEKVFEKLRQTMFKIQVDKSEFLKKEVAFLGYIVAPVGVKPNPKKIKGITKYSIQKTAKEIKGFLGILE